MPARALCSGLRLLPWTGLTSMWRSDFHLNTLSEGAVTVDNERNFTTSCLACEQRHAGTHCRGHTALVYDKILSLNISSVLYANKVGVRQMFAYFCNEASTNDYWHRPGRSYPLLQELHGSIQCPIAYLLTNVQRLTRPSVYTSKSRTECIISTSRSSPSVCSDSVQPSRAYYSPGLLFHFLQRQYYFLLVQNTISG
ncbi:hypothetical protein BDR05DRAFT_732447 [Suillus weaverae]|nr:hypothetical protein BDR05DRAFT_732447 [Suillus weaverae]